MTGLFAPKFKNKVQKKNNLQAYHYENVAPTLFLLQSKRPGYWTCTVHFKVIHEHFSQTFKPLNLFT